MLDFIKDGGPGFAFGELALMNDKPRSATVETLQPTSFAVLRKEYFKKILQRSKEVMFETEFKFFNQFSYCMTLHRHSVQKLFLSCTIRRFRRDNVIY